RSDRVGQLLPAIPVVLGHAVLDGDDWVVSAPLAVELDKARGVEVAALALEPVQAVLVELARRRVERDGHLHARLIAGLLDRVDDQPQRILIRPELRREPT